MPDVSGLSVNVATGVGSNAFDRRSVSGDYQRRWKTKGSTADDRTDGLDRASFSERSVLSIELTGRG